MDIREKIAKAIYSKYMGYEYRLSNWEDVPYKDYWYSFADAVITIIREDTLEAEVEDEWRYAIEEKPSLLSPEELLNIKTTHEHYWELGVDNLITTAQAQREKDIAFYERYR